jgi:hypothetical protein
LCFGQVLCDLLFLFAAGSGCLEAEAVVAGFEDVAMMGQSVEQLPIEWLEATWSDPNLDRIYPTSRVTSQRKSTLAHKITDRPA